MSTLPIFGITGFCLKEAVWKDSKVARPLQVRLGLIYVLKRVKTDLVVYSPEHA
jgi:hypothetical protein